MQQFCYQQNKNKCPVIFTCLSHCQSAATAIADDDGGSVLCFYIFPKKKLFQEDKHICHKSHDQIILPPLYWIEFLRV